MTPPEPAYDLTPTSMPEPWPNATKGPATSQDYWNLPEGRRAELVGGRLYDMAPPSRMHQRIVHMIAHLLQSYIDEHGGPCQVYPAPFAVNLEADDATWVEPDVSVICDPAKLSDRGCEGAPDLVVEVASPSNRRMDYYVKSELYDRAGVREYWVVDPKRLRTTIYRFGEDGPIISFTPFDQPAPVGIFPGLQIAVGDLVD